MGQARVEFEKVLSDAIETYNDYRGPIATVDLVEQAEEGFRVRFKGSFCRTCRTALEG